MSPSSVLRVAYTLEQCWHRVPGGTASSALGVAAALAARDDVEVIGVAARHSAPPPEPWRPAVPVAHLPLPRRALYESWHVLRRPRVSSATGAVSVIHATGMAIPPREAPLVVTVHDLAFLANPAYGTRNGRRFFRQSLDLTRRDADLVLCPSQATQRDCVAAGIEPARVRVVPWGVTVPVVAPGDVADVRRRHRLPERYLLWIGTIEPRKNLPALVEAYRRLARPDLGLVLVGPDGWHTDLAGLLATLEPAARSNVHALGFVPASDRDALCAGAAVFCYPSITEGFGLPVLEAMAAGAPVVTSAGTATAEVAGDAGRCVEPRDPQAIADAIAGFLDDDGAADAARAAGRARAATFTWARSAEATVAAYREVAS